MRREVTVGGGHAGGQLGWIQFGLGPATSAEVRVQWPDGEQGPWQSVTADGHVILDRAARRRAAVAAAAALTTWRRRPDGRGSRTSPCPSSGCPATRAGDPARGRTSRASTGCARRWTRGAIDRLVLYADREHSANLAWLTGFDPRFEEAIAVVGPAGEPAILVGNECYGTAGAAPLPMRRALLQDLSLPGPAA